MRRLTDWMVVCWAVAVLGGCGASQQTTRKETDRTVVDKMDAEWTPDEESWAAGESSDAKGFGNRVDMRDVHSKESSGGSGGEPASSDRGAADSGGYEMTYHDCNVLAGHYYRVILKEEMGKIPDGFKPAQRAAAERSAEQSARKGKEEWLSQCSGLVGSAYQRSWLTCGMKATTVKGFTDCVTGGKKK